MTEEETIRILSRDPWLTIFTEFMATKIPVEDRDAWLEARGWTREELIKNYKEYYENRG